VAELISSDRPLTEAQRATLVALLDTLVPASDDGRMPSAADMDFLAHIERQDTAYLQQLPPLLDRFDAAFAARPLDERCTFVQRFSADDPAAFNALLLRVYDCYYQDDRVRRAIGVVTGAPFPQGNVLEAGDLSLLDPVLRNADRHRYREA
jgi:hypothetical protein